MLTINFLSEWNSDRGRTWSGTNLGLFNAFKPYFCVNDININTQESLSEKILRKLRLTKPDMGVGKFNRQNRVASGRIVTDTSGDNFVFQFAEIIKDSECMHTYIYQDASVDYVYHLYLHNPEIFAVSGYQNFSIRAIQSRRKLQNAYYNNCSGIFTMSHWLKDDLINRTGLDASRVHHVGGGINVDPSLIDGNQKKGNKILFIGRDYIRKGLKVTMEAFRQLKQQDDSVELHVAGPNTNPYADQIIPGYFYYGDCNHNKISELLNKCDVFCMPSYFEAYGLVFIEALTYGLPCIGRNCCEMPYFIEGGGYGLSN